MPPNFSDDLVLKVLALSKDATAIYDSEDLHIRFANDAMIAFWGRERDVIGMTLEDAVPELKGQSFLDILKNVWRTGETFIAKETPAELKVNGALQTFFFDFEYRPIKDERGVTYCILHSATDVTGRMASDRVIAEKSDREETLRKELSATNVELGNSNDQISAQNAELEMINVELRSSNDRIALLNDRLQESETDFRRLVVQAPVAIMVFRGPDLVIDLANTRMLDILSKDTSIIGKPILESMPELKGEPAVELIFEVYRSGKEFDGNEAPVNMVRDGVTETRYFNFSYRPLMDGGKIIGVMDLAVEVTDQVLARKALEDIIAQKTELEVNLRANERRLQGILDTMAEGVVIVDNTGRPTYANPMAQKIMGLNEDQFLSRSYNDALWQNERVDGSALPAEDHPMHAVLRTGLAAYDQELAVVRPGHEKLYIAVNAAPLINANDEVSGCIVTFTDVTNRRKIMQEKDDFISVASHELKTPVTSLKAALQLLSRLIPEEEGSVPAKLTAQANKSLNKLSDLINSLLNSNRVSQGRFPIHRTKFPIADLVNDCCQHVRTAGGHDIALKGDMQIEVEADEQLIDQVLVNLINNAVKYAPNSRDIVIEASKAKNFAKISVTDFGPGIPPEKQQYLFDRYYRASSEGVQVSGIGLGLYICAEIIQKHGGKIGVDSQVDKGSTFWFTLPLNVPVNKI